MNRLKPQMHHLIFFTKCNGFFIKILSSDPKLLIKRLPELQWRNLGFGLEQFAEGLQMFKAQLVGNFAYGQTGVG